MRLVIQRVKHASVTINGIVKSLIADGLLVLVGIEDIDNEEDIKWLANKLINLRIFNDEEGIMNKSVVDIKGQILIVSQFTLFASTKKGNRPSYLRASKSDIAIPIYERFINEVEKLLRYEVLTGEFGADMKVELLNDGPITIIIDSHLRE